MPIPDAIDPRALRNVLGKFVTGVTVVTTRDPAGEPYGVTANSFSSVSLDPPLVLWSQSVKSTSHAAFRDSDHFAVNILAADQVGISNAFARSGGDKFGGIATRDGLGGVPVLDGAIAHLECRKVGAYPGGDHVIFLGQVERMSARDHTRPLAFGGGRYLLARAREPHPVLRETGGGLARARAVDLAASALPRIAEAVGERTVCLAVWGNLGPTAIRWIPSRRPVSDNLYAGLVMSVTRSATGRAFAAFLPPQAVAAAVEEDLHSFRETDEGGVAQRRARFERHVAEARRRGMGRALEPHASPLHQVVVQAFSAPVFDAEGRMALAISVTAPAEPGGGEWDGPVPRALAAAAAELTAALGKEACRAA